MVSGLAANTYQLVGEKLTVVDNDTLSPQLDRPAKWVLIRECMVSGPAANTYQLVGEKLQL